MKLFKILSLTILLHFPLSHAGCDGYENRLYERNSYLGIFTSMIIAGTAFTALGMRDIAKAANTLTSESSEAPLMNNQQTCKKAHEKIYDGLLAVGVGAAFTIISFSSMVSIEASARSNCCNALPSNSTCNWKD